MKLENMEGLMVLLHQRCFYKELITSTIRTRTSSKVKPMSVIKNVTYLCEYQQLGLET